MLSISFTFIDQLSARHDACFHSSIQLFRGFRAHFRTFKCVICYCCLPSVLLNSTFYRAEVRYRHVHRLFKSIHTFVYSIFRPGNIFFSCINSWTIYSYQIEMKKTVVFFGMDYYKIFNGYFYAHTDGQLS